MADGRASGGRGVRGGRVPAAHPGGHGARAFGRAGHCPARHVLPVAHPRPGPVDAAGTGLADGADPPAAGALPDRAILDARLAGLDRTKLAGADGSAPQIGWEVVDVATGEVVSASDATSPLIPASNTKTLTTVAVMNAFAGDERFATTVVQPAPGQVVLVGGGDPMLRSEPADAGAYPQPPTTLQLAADTAAALTAAGQTSVTLGFDASLFEDSGWNETWPAAYRDQVTQLSALWVDEGRVGGVRSRTPALDAARIFAAQLTAAGITVTGAPPRPPPAAPSWPASSRCPSTSSSRPP